MTAHGSRDQNIQRVWDIIEKVRICMLTTAFEGSLRARPLEARLEREAGLIRRTSARTAR